MCDAHCRRLHSTSRTPRASWRPRPSPAAYRSTPRLARSVPPLSGSPAIESSGSGGRQRSRSVGADVPPNSAPSSPEAGGAPPSGLSALGCVPTATRSSTSLRWMTSPVSRLRTICRSSDTSPTGSAPAEAGAPPPSTSSRRSSATISARGSRHVSESTRKWPLPASAVGAAHQLAGRPERSARPADRSARPAPLAAYDARPRDHPPPDSEPDESSPRSSYSSSSSSRACELEPAAPSPASSNSSMNSPDCWQSTYLRPDFEVVIEPPCLGT